MLHLHNLKSCSYHIPSKMYGGDEGEATGEDLELERYGLTEGQYSGSGESDTEEALYRQVHYDIGNDNNIQSITEEDTKPSFGTSEDTLLPSSRDSPDANPGKDNNDGTSIDISDVVVASDDDDCHDWKRVESNSKYNVSIRTKTKPGIADISLKSGRKRKAVVVVSDSAESDIIFLESKTKSQETLKKEGNSNLGVKTKNQDSRFRETLPKEAEGNPRKRSWRNTSDDGPTKITKIDRTGWSSAHEGPEGKAGMSETSKVVIIADDSSSSSVLFLDSERSEEDGSQPKGRPLKDDTEFFLDNKGMALEDVQRDKVSAEQGWKAERMKTKAMLKEGVDIIDVSSGDEDCMVIESCSEEEGLHVHFDEKGERISPGASTSSANNSGKNRGKRKGGEIAAPGRYFVQSRQKHIRCHNCNEMGHLKSECPQPPHVPACILCGKRGHTDRYCPDALCFNCSLPGHQSRSCPVKRHIRYAKCTRCQMNGHLRKMCPDIWRQYHLTTEHGPIIKPNNTHHRSKRRDMYCSNCSRKGHRYYDCRSEKLDEFVVFTYDKVCFYDRKHIGKMVYPAENKNADYLKLCRERKSGPTLSTKDQTTLHQGDEPKSITIEDLPPLTKKRKSFLDIDDRDDDYPRESITEQHLTRKKSRSWTEPQSVQKFGDEMAKGRNKDRMQTEPTDLPKLFSFEIGLPGSVSEDKGDDVSMRKSIAEQQLTKKKRKSRTELKNVPKSGGKKAKASNKNGTLTEPTDLPKLFSSEIGLPGYVSEGKGDDVSMRKSIAEQQLTKKKRKSLTELKNVPKSGSKKAKASNKNRTLTEPTDLPKLFSSEIGFPGYVPEGKGDDVSMRKSITGQQLTKKKRKSRPEANSVLMSGAKKTEVLKKNRTKADVQKTSSLSSETVLTVSFPEDKGDYDSSKTNDAKQTTKKNISKNGQNTKCDGKEVETREKERTSTEINNVQKSGGIQSNQKNRTREETNVIPKCKEKKKKKKRGKKKKSQDQTEQSNDEQFRDKKSQASSKQQSDITPTTKSAKRKKRRRKAVTDLSDGALPSLCPYKVENDILQTSKERSWAKKALKPINRSISILNQKVKTNKGHKALDIQEYRAGLEKAKHSAKLAILAAMHRFHEAKERKREFIKAGVSPECFCKAQQKMREALTKAKRRCPKSSNQGYAPVELGSSRMSQEQRREFLCYNSLKQGTFNLGPVT